MMISHSSILKFEFFAVSVLLSMILCEQGNSNPNITKSHQQQQQQQQQRGGTGQQQQQQSHQQFQQYSISSSSNNNGVDQSFQHQLLHYQQQQQSLQQIHQQPLQQQQKQQNNNGKTDNTNTNNNNNNKSNNINNNNSNNNHQQQHQQQHQQHQQQHQQQQQQQQLRYDAPDDCHYKFLNNDDEVSLTCNLRTVNSEFDTTNFSVIPSEHTISLTIICNDEIMAKSSLEPKSFIHLQHLKELNIEYCKIAKFNKNVLDGLNYLKNFTLRTHNINWSSLNLDIDLDSFLSTKNLEQLDLSQNNIWSLPDGIFCSLNGLTFLNMSGNRLQDLNELGFRDKQKDDYININNNNNNNNVGIVGGGVGGGSSISNNSGSSSSSNSNNNNNKNPDVPQQHHQQQQQQQQQNQHQKHQQNQQQQQPKQQCSLDLEILDVSYNHFVLLPSNGFGILRRLKQLKLNNNEISMIADRALNGLKNLQILDLSSNNIVALPSELFTDLEKTIQEVYLQNNSISVLSPKLFANLEQLQALDLSSNQITSTWIDRTTFKGLIRLVLLNLSFNKITKLESEIFTDLYTLQILNLRHNQLENIAADTFSPMNNLHTLLLSHNKLKYLDALSLNGLYVLSLLSLDNNLLYGIHSDAFRNCSSLQDLNLNGNQLKTIPLALRNMRLLRTIDLGENHIKFLDDNAFHGLTNLYGLRLIGNYLENITINSFRDLPSLQILNLARNHIQSIDIGTFEIPPGIQAIRLDGNELTDITDLFNRMQTLLWLNISDNKLETFDFEQIPLGLQWLDLHKNQLIELSNNKKLDTKLRLQTLDVSFNHLKYITSNSIPNSIELLFLNDNLITQVESHTFIDKKNLTRVDLYANQITTLDIKALRILPYDEKKLLPEFYIGGNPFICDCTIDWLQKINNLQSRQYPRIMDLDTIYCKLLNNRERSYIQLINAEPKHFLCTYKTHCFALCHCCEFDACDCEMTCPNNCTCFHDQSWSTNIVECSSIGYQNELPTNIPMDTTEVYIDGNNLYELSGHSFIGRKNLIILFANNSNIQFIYNTTFSGLKRLMVLHLEDNRIYKLYGNEFINLENLHELYLQNNRLSYIMNGTFKCMTKLEILRLDGNKLIHFEVGQLQQNPYLVEITLSDNMWSCECSYLNRFRIYLQQNSEKIIDSNRIACVYNNLTSILKEKNGTKCTLRDGISTYVRTNDIEHLLPLLLAATCAFIGFFGLILGIFCYRHELNIWLHTNCVFNLCYKSTNFLDQYDKDKLYDAYLAYSLQDEHFINQILSITIENDIGYRLCLHYRDFNVNSYIADTIMEAVESSKQTIIVLSKNFLYNEWTRFEYKSAMHEIIKRRKRIIFILYGDLPQRDIDGDMRHYLRTNTCIEWDDKKFWQKLRIAMPNIRKNNHCMSKQSGVNIYATAHDYGVGGVGGSGGGVGGAVGGPRSDLLGGGGGGGGGGVASGIGGVGSSGVVVGLSGKQRFDCSSNYATINDCSHNYGNNFDIVPPPTHCKYSTINNDNTHHHHYHHQQKNNLSIKSLERKQHEYAVPTNCLLGSTTSTYNVIGGVGGVGGGIVGSCIGGGGNSVAGCGINYDRCSTGGGGDNNCECCPINNHNNKYGSSAIITNTTNCSGGGIGGGCSAASSDCNRSLSNSGASGCIMSSTGCGSIGSGSINTNFPTSVNNIMSTCQQQQQNSSNTIGGGSSSIILNYSKKCSCNNSLKHSDDICRCNIPTTCGTSSHYGDSNPSLTDYNSLEHQQQQQQRLSQNLWA